MIRPYHRALSTNCKMVTTRSIQRLDDLIFRRKNVFSEPWDDSDVVLVVEGKEFHVHRWMLSLQSPVFKAMFNGNFKDSAQEKIELKDDKHQAMLLFLKLMYPPNMLDKDLGAVDIKDENVSSIVELADKYEAKNVIKQCLTRIEYLQPENTMHLLPYALRHELPVQDIHHVIARHISTDKLENFAPELDNDSVYIKTLVKKCRVQEDAIKQANTVMQHMINKHVTEMTKKKKNTPAQCVRHNYSNVQDFKMAKKCRRCLKAYMGYIDTDYVYPKDESTRLTWPQFVCRPNKEAELTQLLKLADDIATSLQK